MAERTSVQYIRYYTDGSAARQPEFKPTPKRRPLPKVKKQPQYVLYIQPMAVAGVLLSAVLLVMMAVGCVQLSAARAEEKAMDNYVQMLTRQNIVDRSDYEETLDLEAIERSALALGMVPQAEVRHIRISIPAPEVVEEPTFWERTVLFLEGLFA